MMSTWGWGIFLVSEGVALAVLVWALFQLEKLSLRMGAIRQGWDAQLPQVRQSLKDAHRSVLKTDQMIESLVDNIPYQKRLFFFWMAVKPLLERYGFTETDPTASNS